jgi:hypothetical protein
MGEWKDGKEKGTVCGEGPVYTLLQAAEYLHGSDSTRNLGTVYMH